MQITILLLLVTALVAGTGVDLVVENRSITTNLEAYIDTNTSWSTAETNLRASIDTLLSITATGIEPAERDRYIPLVQERMDELSTILEFHPAAAQAAEALSAAVTDLTTHTRE